MSVGRHQPKPERGQIDLTVWSSQCLTCTGRLRRVSVGRGQYRWTHEQGYMARKHLRGTPGTYEVIQGRQFGGVIWQVNVYDQWGRPRLVDQFRNQDDAHLRVRQLMDRKTSGGRRDSTEEHPHD